MRKITLLMMLIVASIGLNAQTWNFTNSKDGWTPVKVDNAKKTDYWELTSRASGNNTNPGLKLAPVAPAVNLGIDVSAVSVLHIKMKNESTTGPNEMRCSIINDLDGDGAETVTKTTAIYAPMTVGDADYKDYYFNFTGKNNYKGTVTEIKLEFKLAGDNDFTGTGNEVFDIDMIEMLSAVPGITVKNDYNFTSDYEGFIGTNAGLVWSNGAITITPTKIDSYIKAEQKLHTVDATNNKTLTIKLTNNSILNNQLRFVYVKDDGDNSTPFTQEITTEDSGEQTYQFDLSVDAEWTGAKSFFIGIGSTTDGKNKDLLSMVISSIVFDNSPALSNESITKDDTQLSIYPNPVRNTLSVKGASKVTSLQIYNVTGQEVLRSSEATVNTSSLTKGVYILKVAQENGAISTKRFIKE